MLNLKLKTIRHKYRALSPSRPGRRRLSPVQITFLTLLALWLLDASHHIYQFYIPRPPIPLDAPFQTGCSIPDTSLPHENAVILMLARNNELAGAKKSITSLEEKFNRWFHYDVLFLNDEPFSKEFQDALRPIVSGKVMFETIANDTDMWGFPAWIDVDEAREVIAGQEDKGIKYGSLESYHHMCRFNSGRFFLHPALLPYRYYWRVEPDIEFLCSITYDPFRQMALHKKIYGYVMAIWELPVTAPSLFKHIADYKAMKRIPSTDYWNSFVMPSWAPWFLRSSLQYWRGRDAQGDQWNWCHYWSNFEIADMEWFRSREYREFFDMLDLAGGIYYERWGDAPIHSLAAALLLRPEQTHKFSDFGYTHDGLQTCPENKADAQLLETDVLNAPGNATLSFTGVEDLEGSWVDEAWDPEVRGGEGCRCSCKKDIAKELSQRVCGWQLGRAIG